jgi:hypothetical protein
LQYKGAQYTQSPLADIMYGAGFGITMMVVAANGTRTTGTIILRQMNTMMIIIKK